jgi:hypothetical protein
VHVLGDQMQPAVVLQGCVSSILLAITAPLLLVQGRPPKFALRTMM